MMAWRRSVTMAVSAVLLAVALAGCSAPAPAPTPVEAPLESPSQSAPLFASEEEALAAATEAYERYLVISDEIYAEGGVEPGRIAVVAVGEARDQALDDFESLRESGLHGVGSRRLLSVDLQEFIGDAETGESFLSAYMCVDLAGLDIVDSSGASAVQQDRDPLVIFVSEFESLDDGQVALTKRAFWRGVSECD